MQNHRFASLYVVTFAMSFTLVVLLPAIATAQTADGETPAEEDVCAQAGLTGGMKGLCNAYCEAMDCDSDDPHASAKACGKVKDNWNNHSGGAAIPCETECPCWGPTANLWDVLDNVCFHSGQPAPNSTTNFQDFSGPYLDKVVANCYDGIGGNSLGAAVAERFFDPTTGEPNTPNRCLNSLQGIGSPDLAVTDSEFNQCTADIVNYPNYDSRFVQNP